MQIFTYTLSSGCIKCDGDQPSIGDKFLFNLVPQPSVSWWPATIKAELIQTITNSPAGAYIFSYDETQISGYQLSNCNFDGLPDCIDCCDELDERVTELEGQSIGSDQFNQGVINALDSDGDGDFDADDISGFCSKVATCISSDDTLAEQIAEDLEEFIEIEDLSTNETDTSLILSPDGSGGIQWISPSTGSGSDNQTASEVPYDNTVSNLNATDTQSAIDEITTQVTEVVVTPVTVYNNTAISANNNPFSIDLTTFGIPANATKVHFVARVVRPDATANGGVRIDLLDRTQTDYIRVVEAQGSSGAFVASTNSDWWSISGGLLEGSFIRNNGLQDGSATIQIIGYTL